MDALRALIARKDALEAEAALITEQLTASNMGGASGPLVDGEGFPRADVDVHATRTLRNRLAILNTDHRQLMDQIEKGMHELHAAASAGGTAAAGPAAPPRPAPPRPTGAPAPPPRVAPVASAAPMQVDSVAAALNGGAVHLAPFALVDSVDPAGPAASAGLQVGDELLRFGGVHAENHDQLRALARLTQRSEGDELPVIAQREGARVEPRLRPRTWAGPGLLGCHLTPM